MKYIKILVFYLKHKICLLYVCSYLILFFSFTSLPSFGRSDVTNNNVSVNYLSGWVKKNKDIQGAIIFKLEPNWKTYYKKPGKYGKEPIFDWSLSKNISKLQFSWPTPKIINQYETITLGYFDELILPILIVPKDTTKEITLDISIEFGICTNICVPVIARIRKNLTFFDNKKPNQKIITALNQAPADANYYNIKSNECTIKHSGTDAIFRLKIKFDYELDKSSLGLVEYNSKYYFIDRQESLLFYDTLIITAHLSNINPKFSLIERDLFNTLIIQPNIGINLSGCT